MAPRKEKSEKTTADQGAKSQSKLSARYSDQYNFLGSAMIVDYLRKQKSVSSPPTFLGKLLIACVHLQPSILAQAAKTLKELHENQVIAGRAAGKQLVYHAVQNLADVMSLDELAAMDREIATLRDSIATARANEKLLRANLISVNATLSTDELRSTVILLEHEKRETMGRLDPLRSGNVKPVLPEEKEAVDREWLQWSKKAGVRKKICLELWEFCTEEVPEGKTKEELWEDWGLEGDED